MDNNTIGEEPKLTTLIIAGTEYTTLLNKKFERRKPYQAPNEKHVLSYIPGTVLEILVKPGQEVIEGEILLNLEAMKMKNKICSPIDGIVKTIHVETGRTIPKNTLMVEFE